VFYISGHGFGHASRVIEVINAVGARAPRATIIVRTSAARWLFDATLRVPARVEHAETDTGVLQLDSLRPDIAATTTAASDFYRTFDARVAAEVEALKRCGATAVVADLPPLAFPAARRAGIPGIAHGNFTWDWIYEGYPELMAGAPHVVPTIRQAHADVSLTLRLPMWGGFEGWTAPVADIPLVARRSSLDPAAVRARLGIAPDHRFVLASFGGLGIKDLDLAPLAALHGYTIATTGHGLATRGAIPDGILLIDDVELYKGGIRYEDLVKAADVVVTKPGYGIIAECAANDTALLYTSRGHFVEYDVLVAAMPRFLRARFIAQDALYAGAWGPHLDALLAQPAPPERAAVDGADVAAEYILGAIE
jgi:L-arabinokinase